MKSARASTALELAQAALEAHARAEVDDGGASAFDEPEPAESGFLDDPDGAGEASDSQD